MQLIIDGFNLLHISGFFAGSGGNRSLGHLQLAFLQFLAERLGEAQASRTTVVFDAKGREAVRRRTERVAGMTVCHAARNETADDYIADLLGAHHSPRQVLVVSSDHGVQRAARQRRAKWADSDHWYATWIRRRISPSHQDATEAIRRDQGLSAGEAAGWLREFAIDRLDTADLDAGLRSPPTQTSSDSRLLKPPTGTRADFPQPRPNPPAGPAASREKRGTAPQPPLLPGTVPVSSHVPPVADQSPAGPGAEGAAVEDDVFPAEYLAEIVRELQAEARRAEEAGRPTRRARFGQTSPKGGRGSRGRRKR
ncbi:MAG: NYN domain-containing protein [Pirellulaceae bacterium]